MKIEFKDVRKVIEAAERINRLGITTPLDLKNLTGSKEYSAIASQLVRDIRLLTDFAWKFDQLEVNVKA